MSTQPEPRSAEEWVLFCVQCGHRPDKVPWYGLMCVNCARAFAAQECATLQQRVEALESCIGRVEAALALAAPSTSPWWESVAREITALRGGEPGPGTLAEDIHDHELGDA